MLYQLSYVRLRRTTIAPVRRANGSSEAWANPPLLAMK